MKCLMFIITFGFLSNVFPQNEISHILKAYPDWKTNFSKSNIDYSELISGGPPKDGIPAILSPEFEKPGEAAAWLDEKEPLILVDIGHTAKGYPLQILIWHELVNDKIGTTPVLVSFCPLCYSTIVFDRRIDGNELYFGVSGLLRKSDLVMYDFQTESFWQQFTGEAIAGDFTGRQLTVLKSQLISFEDFWNNYPDGFILSKNTGYKRDYGSNPYLGYDSPAQKPFMFNGEYKKDIPPNEKVIGVKIGDSAKAYPYSISMEEKVINDSLNGKNFVVFHKKGTYSVLDQIVITQSKDAGSTGIFDRTANGDTLNFYYINNKFKDYETGSTWNILGKAISGKLLGYQLKRIHSGDYFAFAWFAFHPSSKIYRKRPSN